jgi:type II secretory pathway pseudopilin PulG
LKTTKHTEKTIKGRNLSSRTWHLSWLRNSPVKAFSLIEFVGVVVVLALVATALVPAVLKRVDRGAWTKELSDLSSISNALALQVLRNYSIPNQTNWTGAVANWTTRPASQVSTNNRGYARLFFYDSGGWLTNAPYNQTGAGTGAIVPSGARIAIVSTVAKALPYTNGALSTVNFNSFWNAAQGTVPSYLTSQGWTGKGDDLVIQRVNLDPLFHRLILETRDAPGLGKFTINSTDRAAAVAVPNGAAGTNTYYLDGTSVGLWASTSTSTNLTACFALTSDLSLTFEAGAWRKQPIGTGTDNTATAQSFANQAATFISVPPAPGHQGGDTQGVLSAFYAFMYSYTLWANKCPHFEFIGNNTQDADYQILDALGANSSGIIDQAAGSQKGLLK